jgi:hypothetical protein
MPVSHAAKSILYAFARVLWSAFADTSLIYVWTAFVIIGNGIISFLKRTQKWMSFIASGPFPQSLYVRVRQKVLVVMEIWRGSPSAKIILEHFPPIMTVNIL